MKNFIRKRWILLVGFSAWNINFWASVYGGAPTWWIVFCLFWILFYGLPLACYFYQAIEGWGEGEDCG